MIVSYLHMYGAPGELGVLEREAYLSNRRQCEFEGEFWRGLRELQLLFGRLALVGVGWPRVLGDQRVHGCGVWREGEGSVEKRRVWERFGGEMEI